MFRRTLRPHAERTLDAAEAARDSVVAVRELRGGTATFGTWGTARYYPGVDFVAEFRRRHPSVRVRVVGLNSSEVVEAVRAGDLEAGMVSLPIDDRGLEVQPIMREEILYASTDPAQEGKSKIGFLYFEKGKNDSYLQAPYFSPDLKAPAMTFAVPVRTPDGHLLAVLAGRLLPQGLLARRHAARDRIPHRAQSLRQQEALERAGAIAGVAAKKSKYQ